MRRAAQVAPTVIALRSMASEVVAAELTRLDARLPGLDAARARRGVSRPSAGSSRSSCTSRPYGSRSWPAGPEAVDYAAALRELFALDPQAVAAVMSPDVGR